MSGMSMDELRLVDELQLRYIDALDRKQMPEWAALFGAEAEYVCTTAESEQAGLPLALIMDDCRGRIDDRVKFVDRVWAGTFQDYQTRHFVQRLACSRTQAGLFSVRSNVAIAFTRSDTNGWPRLSTSAYPRRVAAEQASP